MNLEHLLFPWLANYLLHSTLLLSAAWLFLRWRTPRSMQLRERVWRFAAWGGLVSASLSLAPGFQPYFAFSPETAGDPAPGLGATTGQAQVASSELAFPAPRPGRQTPSAAPVLWTSPVAWSPRPQGAPVPSLESRSPSRPRTTRAQPKPEVATPKPATPKPATPKPATPNVATPVLLATREPPAAMDRSLPTQKPAWTSLLTKLPSSRLTRNLLAFGSLATLLTLLLAKRRMTGHLRDRRALTNGPLFDELEDLCRLAGLEKPVRLSIAPHLTAPLSFGVFRPEIALPPRAQYDLGPAELRAVLAHELAHCVRRDPFQFTRLVLLERLFFFQPLNRLARRELRSVAEILCDDQAVRWTGDSLPLARSLTEVARWLLQGPEPAPTACAMVSSRSPLSERVERLLDDRKSPAPASNQHWFAPLTLALVPAVSLGLPGIVVAAKPTPEIRPEDRPEPIVVPTIAPDQKPRPQVDRPSVTRTGPPIGLRLSFELFENELDSTEEELALLREELEASALGANFEEPLQRMQRRIDEIARRAEQIDRLLPHLVPLTSDDE